MKYQPAQIVKRGALEEAKEMVTVRLQDADTKVQVHALVILLEQVLKVGKCRFFEIVRSSKTMAVTAFA